MKTSTQLYDQHQRLFRAFMRTTTARAAKLCPSSGGNEMLCHNWGNPHFGREIMPGAAAAHAVWIARWQTWRRINAAYKAAYRLALHRQNGADSRPLWCEHCKVSRDAKIAA